MNQWVREVRETQDEGDSEAKEGKTKERNNPVSYIMNLAIYFCDFCELAGAEARSIRPWGL